MSRLRGIRYFITNTKSGLSPGCLLKSNASSVKRTDAMDNTTALSAASTCGTALRSRRTINSTSPVTRALTRATESPMPKV